MPLLDRTPGQSTMPQAVLGSARRQTSTGIDNVFLLALVFSFLVSIVTTTIRRRTEVANVGSPFALYTI